MSLLQEMKTLSQIALAPIQGATHAERLESFYRGQSAGYDAFREKLLHGREALFQQALAQVSDGAVWIDIGAGTGRNLEFVIDAVPHCRAVHLVDLSPSLLDVARRRVQLYQWQNVHLHCADATTFALPERADLITFSYSLSMIPDWYKALENALGLLKEGGTIAAVDFFVSRPHAEEGRARHSWWTRTFWPTWFAADGVRLSSETVEYLRWRFKTVGLEESSGRVPYVPLGKVPYYQFVGKKSDR